jgi:hypothetical protein
MRTHTMGWLAGLGLSVAACADPPADEPAPADTGADLPDIDAPEDDGPYLDDPEEESPPELDAATLAAAVEAVLPLVIGAHGGHIRDAYEEVLEGESGGCPTWAVSEDDVPYWFDACISETGTRFDGYAYSLLSEDLQDGDTLWGGWQFFGIATIERSDGAVFEAPGQAGVLEGTQADGGRITYTYMDEGFRFDGPSATAGWLGPAGSPELAAYTVHYPETGGNLVSLEARVSVDEGPVSAVVFDDIQLGNAAAGSPCPDEPSGLISVRSADGTWFELYFDGVPFDRWEDGEVSECDGCATAWAKGMEVGEVCIDTSILTAWEGAPWTLEAAD